MANEAVLTFAHPKDGHHIVLQFHPNVAGQMRLFYESKGFTLVPNGSPEPHIEPEPQPEPYVPISKRGPKPKL